MRVYAQKKDPLFLLLRIRYVIYTSSSFIMCGFQNIIVTTPKLITNMIMLIVM